MTNNTPDRQTIATPYLTEGTRIKAKELILTNFGNIPSDSIGVVLKTYSSHSIVNWYRPHGEGFIGKLTLNRSDYCKVEVMQ